MSTNIHNQSLREELQNIPNGRFARVGYITEVPVKAKYKNEGLRISKIVEKTVRIGVNYNNISSVKQRKFSRRLESDNEVKRKNPYEWVIQNKIKRHASTGEEYLQIATLNKGENKKVLYIICFAFNKNTIILTEDQFKYFNFMEYVIPSYWNNSRHTEVQTISLRNVLRVNNHGTKVPFNCFI